MTDNQPYHWLTNFKLGIWMEYDDPHHWHALWPPSWKLWMAVQVITCRGRGAYCGDPTTGGISLHSYWTVFRFQMKQSDMYNYKMIVMKGFVKFILIMMKF